MRLALALAAFPVILLAYAAWTRALRLMRQDAKEAAALRLADNDPAFARAYAKMQEFREYLCHADEPWRRSEHGQRAVYVLRGGRA